MNSVLSKRGKEKLIYKNHIYIFSKRTADDVHSIWEFQGINIDGIQQQFLLHDSVYTLLMDKSCSAYQRLLQELKNMQPNVVPSFEELVENPEFPQETIPIANYFEDTYIGQMTQRGHQAPLFPVELWNMNVQQEPASRSASSVISLPQCTVNAAEDRDDAIPGQADLEGDLTLFPQSSTEEIEVSETPEDPGENQTDGEEGREYEECTAEVEEEQCEEMENEEIPRSDQQKDRSSSVSSVVTLPQCTAVAAVELKDAIPGQVEMEAAKEVEDEQSEESETEETFDEETKRALLSKWSTDTLKKAGLYKRHSTCEPILMGFSQYLQKSLMVTHYKQEVQDVARFLYYMNAQRASLDFVKDIKKANKFFNTLRDMKLANQTIFNYLKHVRRFLTYNLKSTNLFEDNATLFNSCKFFIEVTEDIQKRLSKGISREVVGKRYQALMSSTKTPRECQKVLDVARPSFLKCIQNVKHSKVSTKATKLEILYYLEAILVLKHLQRPGVVQNMSVSEWNQRIPNKYKGKNLCYWSEAS
ncbi:uncharacterized protein LOC143796622 [Ranitomeya variabilis]|uniref:uncharacterized protein LOC143796622 n=1 Tax=Ranitomeya variabilis TaxID=490064 RepID=UPI0040566510